MLKNTSGAHRMFRVEGPGIAYGFTMNRREMIPCHWPIGANLYFSSDGETKEGLILTVKAADQGQTLLTGTTHTPQKTPVSPLANEDLLVRFRNNSLLPHKVAIITYKPGETGNGTQIVTIGPYASIKQQLPVGTRVYFADDSQVNLVMSGQPLTGKPSRVVSKDDNRKTFNIW
ncbi:hypothetical protein [Spirosoma gilvum]